MVNGAAGAGGGSDPGDEPGCAVAGVGPGIAGPVLVVYVADRDAGAFRARSDEGDFDAAGAEIDAALMVGGQARTYRLSVPDDYVVGEPLPVVFALNGVGGDGVGAQQAAQLETGRRAIFVYPDSLYDDELGAVAWNFDSTGHDVQLFDALVDVATSGRPA